MLMKNFITMLLAITLVACATTRQVYVPTEGYAMDVSEGDRVIIIMIDGKKHSFKVTNVDEIGLSGSEGSFAYSEMQVVNVKKEKKPPKAFWWLLLSLAVIAVFAEPDDNGSGPLCLYASTDPSRTCL